MFLAKHHPKSPKSSKFWMANFTKSSIIRRCQTAWVAAKGAYNMGPLALRPLGRPGGWGYHQPRDRDFDGIWMTFEALNVWNMF